MIVGSVVRTLSGRYVLVDGESFRSNLTNGAIQRLIHFREIKANTKLGPLERGPVWRSDIVPATTVKRVRLMVKGGHEAAIKRSKCSATGSTGRNEEQSAENFSNSTLNTLQAQN